MFQRRRDGSENFYRGWTEYETGFGNVKGEHWLGLKKLNCLTGARPVSQLRVDMGDFEGNYINAQYRYFSVDDSTTNYKLRVGGYMTGNPAAAGDSLTRSVIHNGMSFTTHDRDNDRSSGNCAVSEQGAWWYAGEFGCSNSNLNGKYLRGAQNCRGNRWWTFNLAVGCYSLKWSEMKLRQI